MDEGGQTYQALKGHYRTANSIDKAGQNGQEVQLRQTHPDMHSKKGGVGGGRKEGPPTGGTMVHRRFQREGLGRCWAVRQRRKRSLAIPLGQ